MRRHAYHGGAFFNAIGPNFSTYERSKKVISADVLDAWFDPSPRVVDKIRQYLRFNIKTSGPTHSEGLVETISKYRKIPKENILVSGGSSDLMFAFFPRMAGKADRVMVLDPMYGEYEHIFKYITRSRIIKFNLHKQNDFKVDINQLINEVKKQKPRLLVLVNPNSPTGQYIPRNKFLKLLKSISEDTLVVVDETYIDYVDSNLSLESEVKRHENLVIIKSMSKAYALSGVRVGYLVAASKLADRVASFIPPFSVGLIGQIAGVEALKDRNYYQKKYQETRRLRNQLIKNLSQIKGLKPYDSVANFVLIELSGSKMGAKELSRKLMKQDIFIRTFAADNRLKDRFIRIAVKDKRTNGRVIAAIRKAL
ncbi:MAG: histidinol-phosphate aminotransferase family protein [Candidatus Doudnabacteria bacterium]|nr:histidinol-phosphate aminotransferase family protein [Candidatus Doudnabacteria bacterium]